MSRVTPWRGSLFYVIIKLFRCRFVPLLEPNPGDATEFHSPVNPDPLSARSLRLLGFPKSPPLKILDPPKQSYGFLKFRHGKSVLLKYSHYGEQPLQIVNIILFVSGRL